jgi:AAA15 family ATPase/GTPase
MIESLKLTDFTCFGKTELAFCKGINVFIGANATGKTHLLKILSISLKYRADLINGHSVNRERLEIALAERLMGYFKPEQLGRLVHRKQGRTRSEIEVSGSTSSFLKFSFANNSKNVKIQQFDESAAIPSLYIPPREMLSLYEGFQSLYEKREVAFDETYYLLAKALSTNVLRGPRMEEIRSLITPLEQEIGCKVVKENDRFYLKNASGEFEAHLVAEGWRKIASLMHLIINGELSKNSVLFWDEPEANLNPKLIKVIAKLLRQLAANGVQVFIASHDFLLTHYLSLFSEYAEEPSSEIRFFSLHQDKEQGVIAESANTLSEINANMILDEFAEYHDAEQRYFNQSLA